MKHERNQMSPKRLNALKRLSVFSWYFSIFGLNCGVFVVNARLSTISKLYELPKTRDTNENMYMNQNEKKDASKQSFDFYVLAMSYQPEFCYSHSRKQMNQEISCQL